MALRRSSFVNFFRKYLRKRVGEGETETLIRSGGKHSVLAGF